MKKSSKKRKRSNSSNMGKMLGVAALGFIVGKAMN